MTYNYAYLKKELKKITRNKKLKSVLKKIDNVTRWRKADMKKEKKQFTFDYKKGVRQSYILDPDLDVI